MYGRVQAIETVEESPAGARLDDAVTVGELEDARLGFFHLLSRRFGREFKERHGEDLFAQAAFEFSRKLEQGEEIRNPAAWITHCAWNRAKDEMAARTRRPELVPTDSLPAEPVAEPSWQPEESFLAEDRMRRVRDAVDQLPPYQRELLARHYFEGESVREASRKLGWSEGKGARAHKAARKKLAVIFEGLQASDIEIGIVAFFSASAAGRGAAAIPGGLEAPLQRTVHVVSGGWHKAIDFVRHPLGGGHTADLASRAPQSQGRIAQLGRRFITGPAAETAAAAGDGPGRVVEVCKVLAVCAVSGTAVTAGIIGVGAGRQHGDPAPARPAPRHSEARPAAGDPSKVEVQTTAAEAPAAESAPTRSQRPSESSTPERASVAHSISGSKTAAATTVEARRAAAEKKEAQEAASSRNEAFGPFEGRGEADSTETESTNAEVQSLSAAKTSSPPAEATEPSPSPKESAEKQDAGERFHGAIR